MAGGRSQGSARAAVCAKEYNFLPLSRIAKRCQYVQHDGDVKRNYRMEFCGEDTLEHGDATTAPQLVTRRKRLTLHHTPTYPKSYPIIYKLLITTNQPITLHPLYSNSQITSIHFHHLHLPTKLPSSPFPHYQLTYKHKKFKITCSLANSQINPYFNAYVL